MTKSPEQEWVDRWKKFGPILEQVRRDELQRLDEAAGARMLGASATAPPPQTSGLAIFQAWMTRLRVLQLMSEKNG